KQGRRPRAGFSDRRELMEMLCTTGGYRIGKFRAARLAHHVNVLHFEIAGRQFLAFEQKIDAAVLAVADLAPNFRILHERLDRFCREGFSDEVVRMRSVDADELQARS